MRRTLYKNDIDKKRRELFKVIAKAGVSPALLKASSLVGGMMVARATEAAEGPNKSILLFAAGGAVDAHWRPSGGMQLKPMSAAYESVKGHMNFLAGGRMTETGHGVMFGRFNGGADQWTGDSFDVNIGRTIGVDRQVRYLNLGVQSAATQLSKQGGANVPTIDSPKTAFSKLFGSGGGGGNTGGGGSVVGPNPRFAFVDAHKSALDELKKKLGQHEKDRLNNHIGAIEEFENTLGSRTGVSDDNSSVSTSSASCGGASLPSGGNEDPSTGDFDKIAKAQIDIAMLALKCDLTSSVSISFGDDNHQFRIPGWDDVFHQSHHKDESDAGLPNYYITANYMSSLCARTISRAQEEGVLDTTIITQVSDMGDARKHLPENVPMFVAGGGISGGQVSTITGKTQIDIFQSVAERLGVNQHADARKWSNSPANI